MSQRGRLLRLFVAVYPPREMVTRLQTLRAGLLDEGLRVVPDGQVHLTMQFIGPTLPGDLETIAESVRTACAGVGRFSLCPRCIRTLPDRGAPRLVAAETDAPGSVRELHRRLAHRLARAPREDAADRFLPHLTLARFRPGASGVHLHDPVACEPFEVERVWLMRSVLKSSGAEHAPLEQFGLA